MLIRVDGGKEGIKEYLVNGQKQGREYTRDQLDERVVLAGDLDFTDQLIQGMQREGERYLHVTLSFKEDDISNQVLQSIVEDFKQFAFSAYGVDEYNLYAEAHLPKIKSYIDKKTGESVERKPHIHVIIPEVNLLSKTLLNPFGKVEHNTKFIDAIQEHINNKYGLASPKDHRRLTFTNESDMIARYKADYFEGSNKAIKQQILEKVLEQNIGTYVDFEKLLTEFGTVKTRNAGKQNAYPNVHVPDHAKGINLKDYVFTKAFIELPQHEKHQRLTADIERKYEVQGAIRQDDQLIKAALSDWHHFRAKEVKYINSGHTKLHATYKLACLEDRDKMLIQQADKFYQKYRGHHEPTPRQPRMDRFERVYRFKSVQRPDGSIIRGRIPPAEFSREYHPLTLTEFAATQSLHSMPALSGLPVAFHTQGSEVLLSVDARDQLGQSKTRSDDALRRNGHRGHRAVSGRQYDGVLPQIIRDTKEEQQIRVIDANHEFAHIKRHLHAHQLLVDLAHSHGVLIEKYLITKGKDGGDRIQVGNRYLNVSDFLTKEMHLSWQEAAEVLRQSYQRQVKQIETFEQSLNVLSAQGVENKSFISNALSNTHQENALVFGEKKVKLFVNDQGDPVYCLHGKAICRDRGNKLEMIKTDQAALEVGLRLAMDKFAGHTITVAGSKAFKESVAKAAAESGLEVVFADAKLNNIMTQRLTELAAQKRQSQQLSGRTR